MLLMVKKSPPQIHLMFLYIYPVACSMIQPVFWSGGMHSEPTVRKVTVARNPQDSQVACTSWKTMIQEAWKSI